MLTSVKWCIFFCYKASSASILSFFSHNKHLQWLRIYQFSDVLWAQVIMSPPLGSCWSKILTESSRWFCKGEKGPPTKQRPPSPSPSAMLLKRYVFKIEVEPPWGPHRRWKGYTWPPWLLLLLMIIIQGPGMFISLNTISIHFYLCAAFGRHSWKICI